MRICHDSRNLKYRNPFGAAEAGSSVSLSVYAEGADSVTLRLWRDFLGERLVEMNRLSANCADLSDNFDDEQIKQNCPPAIGPENMFTATIKMPDEPALLWYFFIVKCKDQTFYYGNAADGLGGEGQICESEPASFQITVYKYANSPDWYKNSIVYQIFPDRFCRGEDFPCRAAAAGFSDYPESISEEDTAGSMPGCDEISENNFRKNPVSRSLIKDWDEAPSYEKDPEGRVVNWRFHGGTLKGIESKLTYIKSLGASAIYLNPIFKALSNHRYDTADYMTIDPLLGTEEDFVSLCKAADDLGIHIILDGVFSHTGDDSIYFDKYGNFGGNGAYASKKNPEFPNRCYNPDSPYFKWYRFYNHDFPRPEGEDPSLEYECWWGFTNMPNVEENDPSHLEYICGKDGVIKKWLLAGAKGWRLDVADELPDSFIRSVRDAVKSEGAENLVIGEVWEDASNKISYGERRFYFAGNELDGVMNYPFRDAALAFLMYECPGEHFCRKMLSLKENYPRENFYSNFNIIDGHDSVRAMTVLGGCRDIPEDKKHAFRMDKEAYNLAMRRLMLLSVIQFSVPGVPVIYYGDEVGLEGHADPYNRGPYPWNTVDDGTSGGLKLLNHYRRLGQIYNTHSAFKGGDFDIYPPDEDVMAIRRSDDNEQIITLINRNCNSSKEISLSAAHGNDSDFAQSIEPLFKSAGSSLDGSQITLEPLGFIILIF